MSKQSFVAEQLIGRNNKMKRRVSKSKKFKRFIPQIDDGTGKLELIKAGERTIELPFFNLLDLVEYYLLIAKSEDEAAIKEFVEPTNYSNPASLISNGDMYTFVLDMLFNTFNPAEDDDWMDFDNKKLDELLKDPFFDEYNSTIHPNAYERDYPLILMERALRQKRRMF